MSWSPQENDAFFGEPQEDTREPEERENLGLSLCPFCGGAARFGKCVPGEQEGENDGAEYVECCDCGASTCLVFPLMDSAKQVLRDMWNRRAGASHEG